MLLTYLIVDFYLFYDGVVDIQIWALLAESQCKVSYTKVKVKACGLLVKVLLCIFAISLLFPPRKGHGPSFEQTWIPITQGCFVPNLVEIGPMVFEKKLKMCKVYKRQTTGDQKS